MRGRHVRARGTRAAADPARLARYTHRVRNVTEEQLAVVSWEGVSVAPGLLSGETAIGRNRVGILPAMTSRTVLVAGATGIVGSAAVEHFASLPGWNVVALSRRPIPSREGVTHVAADLLDLDASGDALGPLDAVTHVLYAALYEKPDLVAGWRDGDQMAVNTRMLRNLLDLLEARARGLRHLALMQGTKAYGLHDVQIPIPAKEHWPRAPHAVFYWPQEDLVRERSARGGWSFGVLRPQLVLGHSTGSPMNVVAAIGVYCCVMRELGMPLRFPGGGRYVHAASDSRLIAQAAEFSCSHPAGAGQTFNVVNGDVMVWQDLFPAFAAHFGMPLADPEPMCLAEAMPAHEAVWARIVKRHGLHPLGMRELLNTSWQFTDRTFGHGLPRPIDRVVSPIKLREAGFAGCYDTEASFLYWLGRLQETGFLPP